jgi:hypothetical protein
MSATVAKLEFSCMNYILTNVKYKRSDDLNRLNIPVMMLNIIFAIMEFKRACIQENRKMTVLDSNTTSLKLNKLKHKSIYVNDLRVYHNDPNGFHDLFDNDPNDLLLNAVRKFQQISPGNLMNLLKCDMNSWLKCGVCQIRTSAYLRIYVDIDGNKFYLTVCRRCVVNSPSNVNSANNVVDIYIESKYKDKVCHWLPYVKGVIIRYKHYKPICCTDLHPDVIIQDYIRHHYAYNSIEFDTDKCNFRIGNIDYECSIRNTICFVQTIARELIERKNQ